MFLLVVLYYVVMVAQIELIKRVLKGKVCNSVNELAM